MQCRGLWHPPLPLVVCHSSCAPAARSEGTGTGSTPISWLSCVWHTGTPTPGSRLPTLYAQGDGGTAQHGGSGGGGGCRTDEDREVLQDGLRLLDGRVIRVGRGRDLQARVLRQHEQHGQHEVLGRVLPADGRRAVDERHEPAEALAGELLLDRGGAAEGGDEEEALVQEAI